MKIRYESSVYTPAGWRGVSVVADATASATGKMAVVNSVLSIDGETSFGYTSRTGAKRQTYNSAGIARREIGVRKRLSACTII